MISPDHPKNLWDLLALAAGLRALWENQPDEAHRAALAQAWDIHITCPGHRPPRQHRPIQPGDYPRCTATVLSRHAGHTDNHLAYRGACLGCGWLSPHTHLVADGGENRAVEDALDHTHPPWRSLPLVARPPRPDHGARYQTALAAWRARWEPHLPPGWLDSGGPIRTLRDNQYGTRHVPQACPGGGYDVSAARQHHHEALAGQLALFTVPGS